MREKLKAIYNNKYVRNPFIWDLILAFLYNLLIETLARNSMPGYGGFVYLFTQPLQFITNMLIIYATLVVSTLFRRSGFVLMIVSAIWISIGVANGIILTQRMTPFTMKDLASVADAASIATTYFHIGQIVGVGVALAVLAAGFVWMFLKGPRQKGKINLKRNFVIVLLIIAGTFGFTQGMIKANVMSTFFGNLAYAYRDYGVPYCFVNTWLNTGIKKPSNYSEASVKKIFKKDEYTGKNETMQLKKSNVANEKDYPNILFLQLESFVDPELFTTVKLSQDPIPYYRSLMKKYSSGSLTVPACGAGTANTEFEVMTGLSVRFFGPGEYPFKSILKEETAESAAYDLKSLGYGTHAIHNHRALFYNRNTVFANLGYDTFTSVEYMSDVERTPKNWEKDKILTSQIVDALDSTKTRDYIYTISVQGHGKYPTEKTIQNPKIKVSGAPDKETKYKYEYYVNEVYEMDQFIKKLIKTLSNYDEPIILVMYGDHIPALDVTEDQYKAKDLYQTQYVIWSNFGLKKKDKDLAAYQLTAEALDRIGIHTGTTTIYHQNRNHNSSSYLKNLKLLAYDMLYGNRYIYGGKNPFKKTNMKMGVKEIKIDKVVKVAGKYYIKGQNFTEYSKVTLDGKKLDTVYLGPNLLGLNQKVDPADASRMKVSQIDKSSDTIISTTE
ncbi:MAG: sulfatase-like hydrolase/transferase [Anaerovoracaceae bacterium]|jgi:phosphoglycerol transferase MdoB-like AlkP superfamily enzyme